MKIRASIMYGALRVNLWIGGEQRARYGLRIGPRRNTFRLFSERHQGTRGIPIRWHYALGGRIAVRIERGEFDEKEAA